MRLCWFLDEVWRLVVERLREVSRGEEEFSWRELKPWRVLGGKGESWRGASGWISLEREREQE